MFLPKMNNCIQLDFTYKLHFINSISNRQNENYILGQILQFNSHFGNVTS